MSAAHDGHSEVIRMLLSAGADVNARDKVRSRNSWMSSRCILFHCPMCMYVRIDTMC